MEALWNKFSGFVNGLFDARELSRYMKAASVAKNAVDNELIRRRIKFTSHVADDSEPGWVKVDVRVIVDLPDYSDVLRLWESLSEIAYPNLKESDRKGVFLSVDNRSKQHG